MGARRRRTLVAGNGVVVRRTGRRRPEEDGPAFADARGAATNALAAPIGAPAMGDLLTRADVGTRARLIGGLQRAHGNAHVQRLLQGGDGRTAAAVRREPAAEAPAPPTLTATRFQNDGVLEGCLQKKVVLDVNKNGGAFENSIRKLQQALIDASCEIPAGPTGFYGQQTKSAVEKFQRASGLSDDGRVGANTMGALDARFAEPGPNPNPQPGPLPKPIPPGPVDLQTAAALDSTLVQYQFMLTRQRDALQAVRRDLGNLDKPKAPFNEELVKGFMKSFVAFYFGALGGILLVAIDDELKSANFSEGARKVFEEANGKLFESLGVQEQVVKSIEDPSDPFATLDNWFDLRLAELTKKGFTCQLAFLQKVKPALLTQQPADVNEWLASVGKVADLAYQRQYEQELNDWATYQAQAQLGQNKKTKKGGIDLSGATDSTPGLLELTIEGGAPEQGFPVKIESAKLSGFSERTRHHLGKKTIGEMTGVPIAARGPVKLGAGEGKIEIGRNQTDEFFSWGKEIGRVWLQFRQAAGVAAAEGRDLNTVTPEEIAKAKAEDGARRVFGRDLDGVKPQDAPSKKGLESS